MSYSTVGSRYPEATTRFEEVKNLARKAAQQL